MSDLDLIKEKLKKELQEQIKRKLREVILPQYPTATMVYYNPCVEYNDQDDEYYGSSFGLGTNDDPYLVNFEELDYNSEEYKKAITMAQEVMGVINSTDFIFAFTSLDGANFKFVD